MPSLPGLGTSIRARIGNALRGASVRGAVARIGAGTRTFGRVTVSGGRSIEIGDRVSIGDRVTLSGDGGRLRVGNDCVLHDFVELASDGDVSIGAGTTVNVSSVIRGTKVAVGERVWIARHCIVEGRDVQVGDRVIFGPYVHVNDSSHAVDPSTLEILMTPGDSKPIRIGTNAWLGSGSMILGGVTIGEGAIIGARSVVTRDVPAMCVAVGNPARVIKDRRTGERVDG